MDGQHIQWLAGLVMATKNLFGGSVPIAEYPCNLPCAVLVCPNHDKLRDAVARVGVELAEPMGALRNRPVVLYGKDLQRTWHDFPRKFSTGVFLVLAIMLSLLQVTPPLS